MKDIFEILKGHGIEVPEDKVLRTFNSLSREIKDYINSISQHRYA